MDKKITNNQLLSISQSLAYLGTKETDSWYAISKNIRKIKPFLEELSVVQKDIVEKYAERDENGQMVFEENGAPKISNLDVLNKTLFELGNETVVVDFYTIESDKLTKYNLEPRYIEPIVDFIITE